LRSGFRKNRRGGVRNHQEIAAKLMPQPIQLDYFAVFGRLAEGRMTDWLSARLKNVKNYGVNFQWRYV